MLMAHSARRWFTHSITAVIFLGVGLLLARTDAGEAIKQGGAQLAFKAAAVAARQADFGDARMKLLLENPDVMQRVMQGGAFGGAFSRHVAQNMFGKDHEPAIEDAKRLTRIEEVAERSWLVRMPIVNAVVFGTDEGLVVVDTGMAPAGPALLAAIRSVSDAPIHTIIYTHGHVDHAYGTWALVEDGSKPQIIAHENLPRRFDRYLRLRGSIAQYMSQPVDQLPKSAEDLVWPTRTFRDRLELEIGGETFVLQHRKGETDDHLYVWLPGRRVLASADFYQGFLPNAGNGKRVQRYVEEWSRAMAEMAALEPAVVMPAHGEALTDPALIQDNFGALAEALDYIVQHTIAGLNQGLRKDQIFASLRLPPHLANHPSLNVQYVSAQDISKMVIRKYTGWWDDLPSEWAPAAREDQAAMVVELAGGIDALVERGRSLLEVRDLGDGVTAGEEDLKLASHLAEWAWLSHPESPVVQQFVLDALKARILDPQSNTQEMLAYLDRMTEARQRQLGAE
jgi:glyoxylase-like metal-dependent hydrolase (beta-lactamase superfamily II)